MQGLYFTTLCESKDPDLRGLEFLYSYLYQRQEHEVLCRNCVCRNMIVLN